MVSLSHKVRKESGIDKESQKISSQESDSIISAKSYLFWQKKFIFLTSMNKTVTIPVTIAGMFGRTEKFCCATRPPVIDATSLCFVIANPNLGPKKEQIDKLK